MRTFVAIVNYASAGRLQSLVPELLDEGVARIVIADNGGDGDDGESLDELRALYRPVEIVRTGGNTGFGAGVNSAAKVLELNDDDALWILNPDIALTPGVLARLRTHLQDQSADIVSPLILQGPPGREVIWFAGGHFDWRRGWTLHDLWERDPSLAGRSPRATSVVSGAAPLISGRAWRILGGFREDYFLYFEDTDLSLRAQHAGLRMAVDPQAVVRHAEGGSSAGEGRGAVYFYYMERNRRLFCREWAPASSWGTRRIRDIETLRLLVRAAREPHQPRQKAWSVLLGARAGLSSRRPSE